MTKDIDGGHYTCSLLNEYILVKKEGQDFDEWGIMKLGSDVFQLLQKCFKKYNNCPSDCRVAQLLDKIERNTVDEA